jgi:hypothetical protein
MSMERQGDEVHIETDEARGGSTPHIVRWVLIVGLTLAIVLLSATWIIGALSMGEQGSVATTTDRTAEQAGDDGDGTDSIVSDNVGELETAPTAAATQPGTVEN